MWQDSSHGASSSHNTPQYYPNQTPNSVPLQFYGSDPNAIYPGSRPSLDGAVGNMGGQGSMTPGSGPGFGGTIQTQGSFWSAFGTGGFEGEPPLLEELGINFSHIRAKSMTVLNPLSRIDERIMDDADLAGPIIFVFCFGMFLLLSGKSNFGYIYGVGLFGSMSIYTLLNLMSAQGIDAYRVSSVLGYCLLPMVGIGAISIVVALDDIFGYMLALLSIIWCTYSASGIFVVVLRMANQRLLVAYPIGLLYTVFALLSIFSGTVGAK